jgi:hypothetical protein
MRHVGPRSRLSVYASSISLTRPSVVISGADRERSCVFNSDSQGVYRDIRAVYLIFSVYMLLQVTFGTEQPIVCLDYNTKLHFNLHGEPFLPPHIFRLSWR